MQSLERVVSGWPLSVVWLEDVQTGLDYVRPGAFVFETRDGFAFVEAGYLDPNDAGHRFRRVVCALDASDADADVVRFSGPEYTGRIERYRGTAAQNARVGDGFGRVPDLVRAKSGRTMAEEHARLRAHLARDLA